MHKILIIGGGPGGTIPANHLAEHLTPDIRAGKVSITLITDKPNQVYKPGFLYLTFGKDTPEVYTRPVSELVNPLVDVNIDSVTKVLAEENTVETASGARYAYDQLILATGARILPEKTPGLKEAGHWFYDLEGAQKLRKAIEEFDGGRVVISVIGVPHMCPVAPLEISFMLDDLFTRRGIRDKTEMAYTYPINRTHTIEAVAAWSGPEFRRRGFQVETFFNADHVDPDKKTLVSMEGTELPFDLLIAIPEHASAPFLEASGLAIGGWVPTNRETLAVKGHEGRIWAIGDTTDLPVSKAGSVAHFEASTLIQNVLCTYRNEAINGLYDGKTICFIEAGLDKATFVEFGYTHPPVLLPPSKMIHWSKIAYNTAYWLTAKGAM